MVTAARRPLPQWAPAALMLGAMALAFVVVNSPLGSAYAWIHHAPIGFHLGPATVSKPVISWINEGLMTLFFLLVGIEIKREIMDGHLASPRRVALPALAALGGMATPAIVFVIFNAGDPTALRGWAIPTATDIVLALGLLSLIGSRVPRSLWVFLAAVAIFDDIGAIIIIAAFYTGNLSSASLAVAGVCLTALVAMNRFGIQRLAPYATIGFALWLAVLESGVHATLAGIAVAFTLPTRTCTEREHGILETAEHIIRPWVERLVIPLFAFFNAGISFDGLSASTLARPLALGTMLGLFLGKQFGILAATWLSVRAGVGALPDGARWRDVYGVAVLAGAGFTMSLFIAQLAFADTPLAADARASILVGSLISATAGLLLLTVFCRDKARHSAHPQTASLRTVRERSPTHEVGGR